MEILFFDPRCYEEAWDVITSFLENFGWMNIVAVASVAIWYMCVGFTCVGMYITTGELTISPSTCCLANQAFIYILCTMLCCSTLKISFVFYRLWLIVRYRSLTALHKLIYAICDGQFELIFR